MSDATAAPGSTAPAVPTPGQVDLSKLDDKHLGQYRHPNERRAILAIVVGVAAVLVVLWFARPYLGDVLSLLPLPMIGLIDQWIHPTRLVPVLLALFAIMWLMDVMGQSTRAWRLVAQAVEVTPVTYSQLAPIVDELNKRFDLPQTRVYISRNAPPRGYTIGVREPFAIVFSSIGVSSSLQTSSSSASAVRWAASSSATR